ncbi:MAG TPA: SDR family oxidoreductase [Rhodoferax sp.]
MKVLVFGATGLLGTTLCQRLLAAQHEVFAFERDAAHPCNSEHEITQAFTHAMEQARPDCVINLVAATNVDQCEKAMGQAALLNCFVPQLISRLCRDSAVHPAHFIQISSDQVYDGSGPHYEGATNPINVYALTKLVGEYAALEYGGCILRTNFFGKSQTTKRSSFSDWLGNCAKNGTRLNVFDDVFFSPLGMDSLCSAILRSMDIRLAGLYNLGSSAEGISKAGMAKLLLQRLGLDCTLLNYVSIESAKLSAPRPKDMRMDSSLFATAAAFQIPTIEQEIDNEATYYI